MLCLCLFVFTRINIYPGHERAVVYFDESATMCLQRKPARKKHM